MTETAMSPDDPVDARPLVARPVNNRATWLFAAAAGLLAILLFASLEARRAARTDAQLTPGKEADSAFIQPPPPLAVPDGGTGSGDGSLAGSVMPLRQIQVAPPASPFPQMPALPPARSAAASYRQAGRTADYELPVTPVATGPALVYQAAPALPADQSSPADRDTPQRVHAGHFENPATTIPQGSVIQAVLETALDSTRAGPARAIVSRDVRGFDGTRVLIPRGSRLYGEYKSDVSAGQNRAMIQWTRLMRPDGVVIALDSPSADPLGRAGVQGKVNSHFFAQFGSALLQSTLNLGVGLATRNVGGGTLVLGLPGSTQSIAPAGTGVKPTLKVAQGTPVSVFVAHDLDFTGVER